MVQASPSCVCWITAFFICPNCVRNVLFVVVLFIPYLRTLIWGSITSTIENHLKTTLMVSLELQLTALSDTQQLPVTYHQVRGSAADRRTHNCEVVGALVFLVQSDQNPIQPIKRCTDRVSNQVTGISFRHSNHWAISTMNTKVFTAIKWLWMSCMSI